MFCKKCGNSINKDDTFCTECGNKIDKEKMGKLCKIIVTRRKYFLGVAISFPVYVDGIKIGDLKNGKTLETEVTEGNHLVEFKCIEKTVKQDVDLNGKESVEINCQANMGLLAAVVGINKVEYK